MAGFRQLPDVKYPDPFEDIHNGYLKALEVLPKFGGNNNKIIMLTWSGAGLFILRNLHKYQKDYEGRVQFFISLGSPWQAEEN